MGIYITCPQCGSPDVTVDAVARWNPDTSIWELSATFDRKTCGSCLYEGNTFYQTTRDDLTSAQRHFVDTGDDYIVPDGVNKEIRV